MRADAAGQGPALPSTTDAIRAAAAEAVAASPPLTAAQREGLAELFRAGRRGGDRRAS